MKEAEEDRYIHRQPGQTVIISDHNIVDEKNPCYEQWGTVQEDGVTVVCRDCNYREKQLKPSKKTQ